MVEQAWFRRGLKKVNSKFKFHYCTLCKKPYVVDGSWESDLCDCRLDASKVSEHDATREIHRRIHLQVVGDPRLDPSFAGLSSKAKLLRTLSFTVSFAKKVMVCIISSSWLFRLSAIPLLQLKLVENFKLYNETGFGFLSICIYVDLLSKEFGSTGMHGTNLLDIALQVLAADPSEEEHYQQLLNNDEVCFETFLGSDEACDRLCTAITESFWKILSIHREGNCTLLEALKNLGNSIGAFLTERKKDVAICLESQHIQGILHRLPETFVWMPIYGGRQEDYVPPANRFASHATH